MKAVCWYGVNDVRVETVPDPRILNPRDAIIQVTLTSICGSDLHLYDGYVPNMLPGDILGHEFMGRVVEVGSEVHNLTVGDRVVVPFPIACGACYFCQHDMWSLCDNSNPKAWMAEAIYGFSPAGIYGYSHLMGGYAGGQAEYVRVPFADVGPMKLPDEVVDEQAIFLTDALPTGYMAAENCGIQPGDTVAVWGCGPVGQFAILSAYLLGAERVIGIDTVPERLAMAREHAGAEPLDYKADSVLASLKEMTGGRGPDACIDAAGMEADHTGLVGLYDKAKQTLRLETGRPHALREAILACRKGGTISLAGVYGGFIDKVPMGAAFNKALTFKMGQTHVHNYLQPLLGRIQQGQIDPTFVISHRLGLEDAPLGYEIFKEKRDGCVKVVLQPTG
jgi:threonine dehydrogenase-like Zn-dependent dehydrogenase